MPETQSASRPSPVRTLEGHNAGDDIGTNALGARNDPLVSVQQLFQGRWLPTPSLDGSQRTKWARNRRSRDVRAECRAPLGYEYAGPLKGSIPNACNSCGGFME